MALVTFVRIRTAEEPHAANPLTVSDGFIASLIVAAIWIPANIYSGVPRSGDELMTSVFFMLTGNDYLWFVPDLLGWALLVVSLHGLLMAMGVTRNASALVVGAIVLNPVIRETLSRGNNDLWVAALAADRSRPETSCRVRGQVIAGGRIPKAGCPAQGLDRRGPEGIGGQGRPGNRDPFIPSGTYRATSRP